jgi:hypothetical protein
LHILWSWTRTYSAAVFMLESRNFMAHFVCDIHGKRRMRVSGRRIYGSATRAR